MSQDERIQEPSNVNYFEAIILDECSGSSLHYKQRVENHRKMCRRR